jgi:hypothetical protein
MSGLYTTPIAVLAVLLALAMIVGLELGRRIGRFVSAGEKQQSAISASTLALIGLLLAFSYSMAAERQNTRRRAAVEDANSIGTFWLRIGLFREPVRSEMRPLVIRWLDLHFEHRMAGLNVARTNAIEAEVDRLEHEMWALLIQDAETPPAPPYLFLTTNALNAMVDNATAALDAKENRLPDTLVLALMSLVVVSSFIIGFVGSGEPRNFLLWALLIFVLGGVLMILIDLDRPRQGLIQTNTRIYERLRESMRASEPEVPPMAR